MRPRTLRPALVTGWLLALAGLPSCSTVSMRPEVVLPVSLKADAKRMNYKRKVEWKGRETIEFGAHRIVMENPARHTSEPDVWTSHPGAKTKTATNHEASYTIRVERDAIIVASGTCTQRDSDLRFEGVDGGWQSVTTVESRSTVECEFRAPGEEVWWFAVASREDVGGEERNLVDGELRGSFGAIQVHARSEVEGSSNPSSNWLAGYEFALNERPVAALQVMNDRLVWMVRDLPPDVEDAIAASMGAVLSQSSVLAMDDES